VFDIFVNYRTLDARFGAASTYEELARRFGGDRVFLDHVSIQPGADYVKRINAALEEIRVLVVLIGPEWLACSPTGVRLVDREGDWVRREIRRALQRGITIIPVLLDGVSLPLPDDLPADIRPILRCQVVEVSHRRLGADTTKLANFIAGLLTTARPSRWRHAAAAALPVIALVAADGGSPRPEPVATTIVGEPSTADPCALIDASGFFEFGRTELDPAYGAFQRCDLIVSPEDGADVDIEVRLEDDPLGEGVQPTRNEWTIGIVAWPAESARCDRTLVLPPSNSGINVVIRAEVEDPPSTVPLCEIADRAADVAAGLLNDAHREGRQISRRNFPAESLATHDACTLLDSDQIATVIPGVDATEPSIGYGNWSCPWESTTDELHAILRFDQSQPLSASDGRPTRIGGSKAFVSPEWEGLGSCTVRVVYRSHTGQNDQTVTELLMVVVSEGEDGELAVCQMARNLATQAVANL
jgi:hypothetical protein